MISLAINFNNAANIQSVALFEQIIKIINEEIGYD